MLNDQIRFKNLATFVSEYFCKIMNCKLNIKQVVLTHPL